MFETVEHRLSEGQSTGRSGCPDSIRKRLLFIDVKNKNKILLLVTEHRVRVPGVCLYSLSVRKSFTPK